MDETLKQNLTMIVKQLDMVIKMINKNQIGKDGVLIQLEGIKAQIEMDLE